MNEQHEIYRRENSSYEESLSIEREGGPVSDTTEARLARFLAKEKLSIELREAQERYDELQARWLEHEKERYFDQTLNYDK